MADDMCSELENLLDSEELAKALRISVKTVYNYHSKGLFREKMKLGRRPLFDLQECLERWNRTLEKAS